MSNFNKQKNIKIVTYSRQINMLQLEIKYMKLLNMYNLFYVQVQVCSINYQIYGLDKYTSLRERSKKKQYNMLPDHTLLHCYFFVFVL